MLLCTKAFASHESTPPGALLPSAPGARMGPGAELPPAIAKTPPSVGIESADVSAIAGRLTLGEARRALMSGLRLQVVVVRRFNGPLFFRELPEN